jgi:hypothetical protein
MIVSTMTATAASLGRPAGGCPALSRKGSRRRRASVRSVAGAITDQRLARLQRLAAAAERDGTAWRSVAWTLLGEARRLRDAGDEAGWRQRVDDLRRLRQQAGKAHAFAALCRRRMRRLNGVVADAGTEAK